MFLYERVAHRNLQWRELIGWDEVMIVSHWVAIHIQPELSDSRSNHWRGFGIRFQVRPRKWGEIRGIPILWNPSASAPIIEFIVHDCKHVLSKKMVKCAGIHCLYIRVQVRGSKRKRLGCHVGRQEVSRCHTKSESEEFLAFRWWSTQMKDPPWLWRQQKSKTGVSVAPQKGLMSFKI